MKTLACATCHYFRHRAADLDDDGYCYLNPPTVIVLPFQTPYRGPEVDPRQRPKVHASDFCSHHKGPDQ